MAVASRPAGASPTWTSTPTTATGSRPPSTTIPARSPSRCTNPGDYLFPGTGDVDETGTGEGTGTCVNVPLPPSAGDEAILQAFDRVIAPARAGLRARHPRHPDGGRHPPRRPSHPSRPRPWPSIPALAARLHDLAHECCAGRWLIVGRRRLRPRRRDPSGLDGLHRHGAGPRDDRRGPARGVAARLARRGRRPPARLLDDPGRRATPRAPVVAGLPSLLDRDRAHGARRAAWPSRAGM